MPPTAAASASCQAGRSGAPPSSRLSSSSQLHSRMQQLDDMLRAQHLTAVPVGRLMRDAGVSA